MEMCSVTKKKKQEGAKKRGKERHEEVRLEKINSISSSAYSKEWEQRESSGSNGEGEKRHRIPAFSSSTEEIQSINLHTTRQSHTITPKSTLTKSIYAPGLV